LVLENISGQSKSRFMKKNLRMVVVREVVEEALSWND